MMLHAIGAAIRAESHWATQGMEVVFHTPSLETLEENERKDSKPWMDGMDAWTDGAKPGWKNSKPWIDGMDAWVDGMRTRWKSSKPWTDGMDDQMYGRKPG